MIAKEVSDALEQVLPALAKYNVEVLVIGGLAVGHYGHNRISGGPVKGDIKVDLDFWYKPTTENYIKLVKAPKELDVDTSELERRTFDPKKSFLKIPHKTFHTDFLPQVMGLDSFQESKKNCSYLTMGDHRVPVISREDLVKNKKAVNRAIDKSDIDALEKQNKSQRLDDDR
jgi:hypothetical protein